MAGFDDPGLFYQSHFFANDGAPDEGRELIREFKETQTQFKKFIREFNTGGFGMIYR